MFARDIKLLHSIKCEISNIIVRKCLSCALSNSNTVIGYKLAFYSGNFNIDILEHDMKYFLEHVKPEPLSIKRQSPVQYLHELSLAKCSQLIVNRFISEKNRRYDYFHMFKVILKKLLLLSFCVITDVYVLWQHFNCFSLVIIV